MKQRKSYTTSGRAFVVFTLHFEQNYDNKQQMIQKSEEHEAPVSVYIVISELGLDMWYLFF